MFWTATERWILAVGAPLCERNLGGHEFIGGAPRSHKLDAEAQLILNRDWDLEDRSTLLLCLQGLSHHQVFDDVSMEQFGAVNDTGRAYRDELLAEHGAALREKGMAAWNHVRRICVAGWGYRCGWLLEEEFFERGLESARQLQSTYASFDEMGRHYAWFRCLWLAKHDAKMFQALERLHMRPTSPWQLVKWEHPLGEQPEARCYPALDGSLRANPAPVDSATAVTQAQRFALGLLGLAKALDYQPFNRIEGVPLADGLSWQSLLQFWEQNRSQAAIEKLVLETMLGVQVGKESDYTGAVAKAQRAGSVEKAFTDPALARQVHLFMERGWDTTRRALYGYHLFWATVNTRNGYEARLIDRADAWRLLFQCARFAQRHFESWEQLWRSMLDGREVMTGEPQKMGEAAFQLLLTDSNSPCRHPWQVDLDAVEPIGLPAKYDVVWTRLVVTCPACLSDTPVRRIERQQPCGHCRHVLTLDETAWSILLAVWTNQARLRRRRDWTFFRSANPEAKVYQRFGELSCTRCREPLDVQSALRAPEAHPLERQRCGTATRFDLVCSHCQEVHRAWLPGTLERACMPDITCVVELDEQAGLGVASASVRCSLCVAELSAKPGTRILQCPSCGGENALSDQQYRALNPPSTPAFALVCLPEPAPLPITWPMACHYQINDGQIGHSGVLLERRCGIKPGAAGYYPPAPDPAMTRLQLFSNQLAELDLLADGGDPDRFWGKPRWSPYRIDAHRSLRRWLETDAPNAQLVLEALERTVLELNPKRRRTKKRLAEVPRQALEALAAVRDATMLDLIEVSAGERFVRSVCEAVQAWFSDWNAWEDAVIRTSDRADALERVRQQRDAAGPDPRPAFATSLAGPLAVAAAAKHDVVQVTLHLHCMRCLRPFNVGHWRGTAHCPNCQEPHDLRALWTARVLEPIVHVCRHLPRGKHERTTDHWPSAMWEIRFEKVELGCFRCGARLDAERLAQERPEVVSCAVCGAQSRALFDDPELYVIDPRIVLALVPVADVAQPAVHAECAHCGAGLKADGSERVVCCDHCGEQNLLSDRAWLRLHPKPPPTPLVFVCTRPRFLSPLSFDADVFSRHICLQGHPCTLRDEP